jgi:hypothetical protein
MTISALTFVIQRSRVDPLRAWVRTITGSSLATALPAEQSMSILLLTVMVADNVVIPARSPAVH